MVTTQTQASITQVRQNMVSNCQWGVAHRAQTAHSPHIPGRRPSQVTSWCSASIRACKGQTLTFLRLEAGGSPPPPPPHGNPYLPLAVDGAFGPQTIKALQWKLGVTTDGIFGPNTKKALQGPAARAERGHVLTRPPGPGYGGRAWAAHNRA